MLLVINSIVTFIEENNVGNVAEAWMARLAINLSYVEDYSFQISQ